MTEISNSWIEKGLEQGLEQGLQRGLEQGRIAERQEIAKKLIVAGLSVQAVSEATGLSLEEAQRLR